MATPAIDLRDALGYSRVTLELRATKEEEGQSVQRPSREDPQSSDRESTEDREWEERGKGWRESKGNGKGILREKCWFCHRYGHFSKECWNRYPYGGKGGRGKGKGKGNREWDTGKGNHSGGRGNIIIYN